MNIDLDLVSIPLLELLRNQIDITRLPSSDRESRLLVYLFPVKAYLASGWRSAWSFWNRVSTEIYVEPQQPRR